MKYVEFEKQHKRKMERSVLFVYSLYTLIMSVVVVQNTWHYAILLILLATVGSSWAVYFVEVKDYEFRAFFTATMMQISMVMYTMQLPDVFTALSTVIAFVVVPGLYGIKKITFLSLVSTSFLFLYHHIYIRDIVVDSVVANTRRILQIGSVYLAGYSVYFWVKKQQEMNEQQVKIIEELEKAQRSKDDFLANVSHEIRTPINTIYGVSEVVLRENLPHSIKEDIFNIQNAGRNLMVVVGDILDFSELQSGQVEIREEVYNISSTIHDVINMSMATKSDKNIELIVDCDANLPSGLIGDEQKIRRVIMNLVNNAIKFTMQGYVSIQVEFRREDYGINLFITVRDSGIGMDQESVEKIFNSFYQVNNKRSRDKGGLGLGLAISRAIISKMGGFINVKSEKNKGTQVQVVIPQKVEKEAPIAAVENKDSLNVAVYIDMEQFEMHEIRDEYQSNINHLIQQLGVHCHVCRNFAELKRREEREEFTHIFISFEEYCQNQDYFDKLAKYIRLIVVLDWEQETKVSNPNLIHVHKPFFVLPIVQVLNGNKRNGPDERISYTGRFIAPEAHVLVVDDNHMNLKVMDGLLDEYKIRVSTAESGKEALTKIESRDYDLVFMDHMMPEMDGIETLKNIRRKPGAYYKKVPIVVLTANAIAGTQEMFQEAGFDDFVAKPVEISVLERVLRRNLPDWKLIPVKKDIEKKSMQNLEKREEEQTEKTFVKEDGRPDGELSIGDLDVQKGLLYCGGKERYLDLLKMYVQTGEASYNRAGELFREKDWKNYTIFVHGIKSSMMSIGAVKLSDLAKALEMAGKEDRISYILEKHEEMMTEYQRVMEMLSRHPLLCQKENTVEENQCGEELDSERFTELISKFEEAVYMLEQEKLIQILCDLELYRYRKTALKDKLSPIKTKVEMLDHMSALESLEKLKQTLDKK